MPNFEGVTIWMPKILANNEDARMDRTGGVCVMKDVSGLWSTVLGRAGKLETRCIPKVKVLKFPEGQ